jgi:glycosyltransferase involved in cell wall biosynthesis
VQKVARSAAAAGWDVTVLGRSRSGKEEANELGGATVRRLAVPTTLLAYRTRVPGRRYRWPLAYPHRERSSYRARKIDVLKRRLTERQALQRLHGAGVPARLATKGLQYRVMAARAAHRVRNGQLTSAIASRRDADGPVTRTRARLVSRLRPGTAWRSLDPVLEDFAGAMLPELLRLEPDLVHAHDFRMVGIAVRAAEQLRSNGHPCKVVYDAHEFLPGIRYRTTAFHLANEAYESLYTPRTDAVVTVSDELAGMLQERHRLAARPTVVMNAPAVREGAEAPGGGVRAVCGLAADVPLLVYAGSPAPQRGLAEVARALLAMPGTHAAALLPPGRYTDDLVALLAELGVTDRFHVLPYVEQDLVVPFLRSADLGLVPIHHHPNHEIALITKYFDYAQAGLPVVTSDVRTMASVTRQVGNGEVFVAGDVDDLVRAVTAVLADPQRYRSAYTPDVLSGWTWDAQANVLLDLYDGLVPPT